MISTRDEIMIKFAMDGDKPEIDSTRFPKTTKLVEEEGIDEEIVAPDDKPEIDPTRFPKTTKLVEEEGIDEEIVAPDDLTSTQVSDQEKPPISQRDPRIYVDPLEERGLFPEKYESAGWPWEDPKPGSVEWQAQHHTQEYLRGVNMPYRGFARDPKNDNITKATMDRLIAVEPDKYFEWGLRMRQELKPWMVPAAEALIDKDPYSALLKGIFKQGEEIKHLLPKLWKDILEAEFHRASDTQSGEMFPGVLFNRMRSLAGELARTNAEFYIDEIVESGIGRKFRTDKFDNWAANALRDQQRR